MTHRPATVAPKRRSTAGDGIIRSYQISSWLVLRVYGAVFLWFAWVLWTGAWAADSLWAYLPGAVPPHGVAGALAFLGGILAVPFLTPSILRFPKSVAGGIGKALLLLVLSGLIYGLTHLLLADEFLRYSSRLDAVLPILIKAVAGMAVTGAILVSLAMSLTAGETGRAPTAPKLTDADLRALRRARARG